MKNGKVKEIFGSKAKEARFKREDRTCHRSEYRKPAKQAKLVAPVSRRTAEKNMSTLLSALNDLPGEPVTDDQPPRRLPGTKFDHLGLLAKPFSMTKGGYTITISNSSWHAVTLTTSLALSVVSTKIFETGWPSFVMSW